MIDRLNDDLQALAADRTALRRSGAAISNHEIELKLIGRVHYDGQYHGQIEIHKSGDQFPVTLVRGDATDDYHSALDRAIRTLRELLGGDK